MASKDLSKKQEKKHNFLWVNFLTRFFLWVSAIYNLIVGAYYVNLSKYEGAAIYERFAALQEIDFEYGIVCCLLFVMFLVCIYLLSSYRRYADVFLFFCYILDIVSTAFYVLLCIYTQKQFAGFEAFKEAFYNMGGCLLLLVINLSYFNKRSYAFR